MGMQRLSSRAIIGSYYKRLRQGPSAWVEAISNLFSSDQASEDYAWLGMAPQMREWIGGRQATTLRDSGLTIKNRHYESTLRIEKKDLRRDKTGQLMVRIGEQATRAQSHWAKLLSTLILNGESTLCYDGQYFFDTDHAEGDSGTLSNKITVDISELPVDKHGTTTAPSVEEMQLAIATAITQFSLFTDDQGEPINEDAQRFVVMVPPSLAFAAMTAIALTGQIASPQTGLDAYKNKYSIEVVVNVRLASWTTKFAVFRTDSEVKPLIRQEETGVQVAALAEGSEYAFINKAYLFGIEAWRGASFGLWQHAVLVTLG